jgi:hypothetical protein
MAKQSDEADDRTLQQQIVELLERVTKAPPADTSAILDKLTSAMDRLAETQAQTTQIAAAERRRATRSSNEIVPNRSAFNPRGETCPDGWTKPTLKCAMYLPWVAEEECLTREEIELLNLLEQGEYLVTRIDDSRVPLEVRIETNLEGTKPTRLLMTNETAFNRDYFRQMPPLHTLLRQMLAQHRPEVARAAAGVLTMDTEHALIAAGQLSVSV